MKARRMKAPVEKVVIWMNIPSHHQEPFFAALRADPRVDLRVVYFNKRAVRRRAEGWVAPELHGDWEQYYAGFTAFSAGVEDWRERTHIIGGTFRSLSVLSLLRHLVRNQVRWFLWSEAPYPPLGWKRVVKTWLSLPVKKLLVYGVNNRAGGLLVISHNAQRAYVELGVKEEKIHLLPYSVADQLIAEEAARLRGSRPAIHFGYVGSRSYLKGTDLLLKAFAQVAKEYPNVHLLLTGKSTQELAVEELVDALEISDKVTIRRSVQSTEMTGIYHELDVFVLPSRYDGWGMVLSEAAAHGIALVSSRAAGGAYHLIEQGVNGFLFQPESAESLALAMLNYCRTPELVDLHGAASTRIVSRFSATANVQRLLNALAARTNQ